MAHEGYSRVLDSFQRANAVGVYSNVTTKSIVKSESGATLSLASTKSQTSSKSSGSSCRSAQKNSSPPGFQHSNDNSEAAVAAAAATVAANIVGLLLPYLHTQNIKDQTGTGIMVLLFSSCHREYNYTSECSSICSRGNS